MMEHVDMLWSFLEQSPLGKLGFGTLLSMIAWLVLRQFVEKAALIVVVAVCAIGCWELAQWWHETGQQNFTDRSHVASVH